MGPKVVKRSHYDQVTIIQSFAGISTLAPIILKGLSDSLDRTPKGACRGLSYQVRL